MLEISVLSMFNSHVVYVHKFNKLANPGINYVNPRSGCRTKVFSGSNTF